ncbi:hypothetical protein WDZ92_08990 [Nostoc sp. NIES-2111]
MGQVILLAVLLQACHDKINPSSPKGGYEDTLTYNLYTIDQRISGCAVSDTFCTHAKIVYPLLCNSSEQLKREIAKDVLELASPLRDDSGAYPDLNVAATAFLDSFKVSKMRAFKINPEETVFPWTLDLTLQVRYRNSLVFLEGNRDLYLGGASNFYSSIRHAFDRETGQRLTLIQLLKNEASIKIVTQKIESYWKKHIHSNATINLQSEQFYLPEMWSIKQDTLILTYNKGEISGGGWLDLKIPLSSVENEFAPHYKTLLAE